MAVAGAVGRGILEDGSSGLGVGDVGAAFAVDAAAAPFSVECGAARAFRGAAVDLSLGALPLGPGLGVRAVVGGGAGAHGTKGVPKGCLRSRARRAPVSVEASALVAASLMNSEIETSVSISLISDAGFDLNPYLR